VSPLALRIGATALTLVGIFGSAGFVARHVKNASAPLHPAVVQTGATARSSLPTPTPRARFSLQPNVRTTDDLAPLTFTYVS